MADALQEDDPLIGTAEIAKMIGNSREHVTDVLVKRPDFPRPEIDLSNKTRRWRQSTVRIYISMRTKARRARVCTKNDADRGPT